MPTFTPPVFANSGGLTATSPAQSIYDATTVLNKRKRALVRASDPNDPYRMANNNADRAVTELTNPNSPYRAASTAARLGLIRATGGANAATRGYYNTEAGFNAERANETQRLQAAQGDVADLSAVAQAEGHRRAVNALRRSVGIEAPIEINTPRGDNTPLPVGVDRVLRSNADYVSEDNKNAEAVRGDKLALQRSSVNMANADVADARLAGSQADLNLENATQGADYRSKLSRQNLTDYTAGLGYERDQAGSDLEDISRAPFGKVLYIDPNDPSVSRYVTPGEKDALDYEYRTQLEDQRYPGQQARAQARSLERIPQDYAATQARTQYATQQEGLGGLSVEKALSLLAEGKLPAGMTEQTIMNALTRSQHMDPNAAFELVSQAKAKAVIAKSPLNGMDESDLTQYLADGKYFEPWNHRDAEVLAFLTAKYGATVAAAKMQQLRAAAEKKNGAGAGSYTYTPAPTTGGGFDLNR